MNLQRVRHMLQHPSEHNVAAFLNDDEAVFWVDWREEEEGIAEACESILNTGDLTGELVEADAGEGYEVYFHYGGRRVKVPLTYTPADRHIALLSLNEILDPAFEIRFCTASAGRDTLAFLPLPRSEWAQLEREFREVLARHFHKLTPRPNLFTEPFRS